MDDRHGMRIGRSREITHLSERAFFLLVALLAGAAALQWHKNVRRRRKERHRRGGHVATDLQQTRDLVEELAQVRLLLLVEVRALAHPVRARLQRHLQLGVDDRPQLPNFFEASVDRSCIVIQVSLHARGYVRQVGPQAVADFRHLVGQLQGVGQKLPDHRHLRVGFAADRVVAPGRRGSFFDHSCRLFLLGHRGRRRG